VSAGSIVLAPNVGEDFVGWSPPTGGDRGLGVVGPRALRHEMGVFGCSSIRGVYYADIGCGSKTLRWASVSE
jgi:hypothetical protein